MKPVNTVIMEPDRLIRNRISQVISEDRRLTQFHPERDRDQLADEISALTASRDGSCALLLGVDQVDSPEMKILEKLRREHPDLPVIVLTRHDRMGARVALAALRMGAVEYILKTSSRTGSVQSRDHFRRRLIPVLRAMPRVNRDYLRAFKPIDDLHAPAASTGLNDGEQSVSRVELIAIAGCLGGVPALYRLVKTLPKQLPVPVVIVQHIPKIYSEVLAEELNSLNGMEVVEARDGDRLRAGKIFVAPGGFHLHVVNNRTHNVLTLNRGPAVKGFRPSIDVFLGSVSRQLGGRVLVTFLSGGGDDGIEGARNIDEAGGEMIIQNRRTSLLWDIPYRIDSMGINSYPQERLGIEISRRALV